jgi:hypothetical protein
MAAPTPQEIFADFTLNSTANTFTFKYTGNTGGVGDMPAISIDEAAAAIDIRTILYAILDEVAAWYETLAPVDRPANMRVVRSGTLTDEGGTTIIRRNYAVSFKAEAGTMTLLPEP